MPTAVQFNNPNLYLEVAIDDTILDPRTLLNSAPAAFWSDQSGNAATLDGQPPSNFAVNNHTHAYNEISGNTAYIDGKIAELHDLILAQQEQINLLLTALTPEQLSALSTEFSQISTRLDQLETSVNGRNVIDDLVPFLSVSGNDVFLTNANLNIQNGVGATDTVNGAGNLVLGYNALKATDNDRIGSHNLIIGDLHAYSSYAGFVAGEENSILAPYATIAGGQQNFVRSNYAAILGGYHNYIDGTHAMTANDSWHSFCCRRQTAQIFS